MSPYERRLLREYGITPSGAGPFLSLFRRMKAALRDVDVMEDVESLAVRALDEVLHLRRIVRGHYSYTPSTVRHAKRQLGLVRGKARP